MTSSTLDKKRPPERSAHNLVVAPKAMSDALYNYSLGKYAQGALYSADTVCRELNLVPKGDFPVPTFDTTTGEVVLYLSGWDSTVLYHSARGFQHMESGHDDAYNCVRGAKAGYWRVKIPFPGSYNRSYVAQAELAKANGWEPAPLCVAMAALMLDLGNHIRDCRDNRYFRCGEMVGLGDRMSEGLVLVANNQFSKIRRTHILTSIEHFSLSMIVAKRC